MKFTLLARALRISGINFGDSCLPQQEKPCKRGDALITIAQELDQKGIDCITVMKKTSLTENDLQNITH
ncbi:hypothetical protein C3433_23330 [Citrobacter freundii]|nr:hypothetical protein C3433_23330 [Citrobacter freundii]